MPAAAISLRAVCKRCGPIKAVDHSHMQVPVGLCFGLLGPNGAAKSTTMHMLSAQTLADSGSVEVLG
jgi:lipooligosaccharide transport system ATP-binding protein